MNSTKQLPTLDTEPSVKQSIYDFVVASIDPKTGALKDSSMNLPDENDAFAGQQFRWVAGGLDGAFGHHVSPGSGGQNQETIWQLFSQNIDSIGEKNPTSLAELLIRNYSLENVDDLLNRIRDNKQLIDPAKLMAFSTWLMRHSVHRDGCKFGIALMGLFSYAPTCPEILTLAKHDEFSLFAAVAIINNAEDPNHDLWQLAKYVHGWGRIQIVERIKNVADPKLQDWLVREGFNNYIMNEYLAYHCAVEGDLIGHLKSGKVDNDLLISTAQIISALIVGGPAESIKDYASGIEVLQLFLNLAKDKFSDLQLIITANQILALTQEKSEWVELPSASEDTRLELEKLTKALINNSAWLPLIEKTLTSTNDLEFNRGITAAEIKNIDTWDHLMRKLEQDPFNSFCWYKLMEITTAERIGTLLSFAQQKLDIESIATGPEDSMGFGEEYKLHHVVDFIIQGLKKFPGKGLFIIKAGLLSPVVRNRNMALNALEVCSPAEITPEIQAQLVRLQQLEVNEQVKETLKQLMSKISESN